MVVAAVSFWSVCLVHGVVCVAESGAVRARRARRRRAFAACSVVVAWRGAWIMDGSRARGAGVVFLQNRLSKSASARMRERGRVSRIPSVDLRRRVASGPREIHAGRRRPHRPSRHVHTRCAAYGRTARPGPTPRTPCRWPTNTPTEAHGPGALSAGDLPCPSTLAALPPNTRAVSSRLRASLC